MNNITLFSTVRFVSRAGAICALICSGYLARAQSTLVHYSFGTVGTQTDPTYDSTSLTTQIDPTNVLTVTGSRIVEGADNLIGGAGDSTIALKTASTGSPANYPYLQAYAGQSAANSSVSSGTAITNALAAETNSCYFAFTVSGMGTNTLNLSSLGFNAARGGSGAPRGFSIQDSVDGFSTNGTTDLAGQTDIPTVRPSYTAYSIPLTASKYQGLSSITFHVFVYGPGVSSSIEFDDFTVNGTVVGTMTGAAPATNVWAGNLSTNWDLSGALNWKNLAGGAAKAFNNNDGVVFDDSATAFTMNVATNVVPSSIILSNSTHNYTFSSVGTFTGNAIANGTPLTMSGSGSLTLGMGNVFGATTISSGTLNLGGNYQTVGVLSGSGTISNSGGTPILTIGSGGGISTYKGVFLGAMGISQVGSGLLLGGANTYTGPTTNTTGTLQVSGTSGLGSSSGVSITGGTLNLTNGTINSPVRFTAGNLTEEGASAANVISGAVTIADGTAYQLTVNSVSGLSSGASLSFQGGIFAGTNNVQIADDNSGNSDPGNIYIQNTPMNLGSGWLQGYGWHINVAGNIVGTINPYFGRSASIGVDNAFANVPALVMGKAATYGKLNLNGHNLTVSALTSTGTTSADEITSVNNAYLTVSNTSPCTYVGIFTGTGLGLVKDGPSTLTLGSRVGANANLLGTTVKGGTLYLQSGVSAGDPTLGSSISVMANATYAGAGTAPADLDVNNGGSVTADGGIGSQAMQIDGNVNLGVADSDLTTNNINVYNGGLIQVAGSLSVNGTNVINILGAGIGVGSYSLITYGSSVISGTFKVGSLPSGTTAHIQNTGTTIQLVVDNSTAQSDLWVGNVSSNWNILGTTNWKGSVDGLPRTFANLDVVQFDDSAANFTVSLLTAVSPTAVTVSNNIHNYVISGIGSIGNSATFDKTGSGTLVLAITNSYTGVTRVDAGALKLGVTNALPLTGTLDIDGGAFDLNGYDQTVGGLTDAGGMVTNSSPGTNTLTLGNGNVSSVYSGLIGGTVGLAKLGAASIISIISDSNTYTGPTLVSAGNFLISGNAPMGNSSGLLLQQASLYISNAVVGVPITNTNNNGNIYWSGPGASNVITKPIYIQDGLTLNVDSASTGVLPSGNATGASLHIAGGVVGNTGYLKSLDNVSGNTDPGNTWIDTTPLNMPAGEIQGFGFHFNVSNSVVKTVHPFYGRRVSLEVEHAFANVPILYIGNPSDGRFDLNGHSVTAVLISDETGIVGTPNEVTCGAGSASLIVSNDTDHTFSGILTGASLKLVVIGNHACELKTNMPGILNTYGGGTLVGGGTLQVDTQIGSLADTNSVVVTNGILAGIGTILDAVTVTSNGTIAPGDSGVGTLAISNSLVLAGTTDIEVNKSASISDQLVGMTNVTFGGTLFATNLAGSLNAGDSFQVFSSLAYSGNFSSIAGSPGAGLAWNFNPTNGVLSVISGVVVSTNAYLSSLLLAPTNSLVPAFVSTTTSYTATNAFGANPVTVTATSASTNATVQLSFNGGTFSSPSNSVTSGTYTLNLNPPVNTLAVKVTAQNTNYMQTYSVNFLLQPSQAAFKMTNSLSGGTNLVLTWPSDHVGYRLLSQTNNLNRGVSANMSDWGAVTDYTATNQAVIPIIRTKLDEYYRLVYP